MESVKQYLTDFIDENAEIRNCPQKITDKLPLFLNGVFDYYELVIMNERVLLIKPVQKQTVKRFKNWMHQIENICGLNTVLLLYDATPYMIKRMLADRIAFVIPGKQISFPFLIMMVKTEKKRMHKNIERFSPVTQLIFLFVLYSETNSFSIEDISSVLDISKMSAQRGLSELENLGLLTFSIEGKTGRKKVFERIDRKDYFTEGKEYLDNPLRKTVYVKKIPETAELVTSDLSALADQTMLGEPEQEYFALYSKFRDQLDGYLVTEEQAAEENLPVVQLMKYDIDKLSRNNIIDPVTMILSLSEKDERIQMSVEELMERYDWYDNEGEEW